MNLELLNQVVNTVSSHGYWFMFFAMLIEGPIVTIAAAFASALGFFSATAVLFVSIAGDIVGDIVYYALGYWARESVIEKYGKKFGFGIERIKKIEKLLKENTWATVSAIKISPFIPTPGLIITGAARIPLKKYLTICFYITLPRSLLFVVLGYYAGLANATADKYLHHSQFALILTILAILIVNSVYKKFSQIISEKIKKI